MFFAPLFAALLALPPPGSARDVPTRTECSRDEVAAVLPREFAEREVVAVEGIRVHDKAQLDELIAQRCPGQRISIMVIGASGPEELSLVLERGAELPRAPAFQVEEKEREEARALVLTKTSPKPEPVERWYGWQTLLVDLGTVLVAGVGAGTGSGELGYLFLGGYFFGPSIVHAAQGNYLGILASVGGRVVIPLGSGLLVSTTLCVVQECSSGDIINERGAYALLGGFLGMLASVAFDAAVLAWVEEDQEKIASNSDN